MGGREKEKTIKKENHVSQRENEKKNREIERYRKS
jgi:hypothetical protein